MKQNQQKYHHLSSSPQHLTYTVYVCASAMLRTKNWKMSTLKEDEIASFLLIYSCSLHNSIHFVYRRQAARLPRWRSVTWRCGSGPGRTSRRSSGRPSPAPEMWVVAHEQLLVSAHARQVTKKCLLNLPDSACVSCYKSTAPIQCIYILHFMLLRYFCAYAF